MAISIEETKKIAKLCNLSFNQGELANITKKINSLLEEVKSIEMLEECIEPYKQGSENIFRRDEVQKALPLEDVFRNTDNRRGDYFTVPIITRKEV